jgi:SAM-dependent methyltransferase
MTSDFDAFAEIYDAWVATGPATDRHVPFYVEEFVRARGPCVELGVGNGRITIAAAERGVDITGVDISPAMLEMVRERAKAAGVAASVKLIEADMRSFRLPAPAALVAIPFSTVGHMLSLDDKAALFRHVHGQLVPGGRLVFDSLVFDPAFAAAHANVVRLRSEYADPATGEDVLLWATTVYDKPKQGIRILAWTDRFGPDGTVTKRRYVRLAFSWIDPEQTRSLLTAAGFEIEHCWGSFDRTPLDATSKTQIWVARKK